MKRTLTVLAVTLSLVLGGAVPASAGSSSYTMWDGGEKVTLKVSAPRFVTINRSGDTAIPVKVKIVARTGTINGWWFQNWVEAESITGNFQYEHKDYGNQAVQKRKVRFDRYSGLQPQKIAINAEFAPVVDRSLVDASKDRARVVFLRNETKTRIFAERTPWNVKISGQATVEKGDFYGDPKWFPKRYSNVDILFKADGTNTWQYKSSVKTDGQGNFQAKFNPRSSGKWRAVLQGSNKAAPSKHQRWTEGR